MAETKRFDGDNKIIDYANALLGAIAEQGYCVRSQENFGSVDIYIHGIGTDECVLEVENTTNARKEKWNVRGKLTAALVPEKEEK
ncbi:MAG: hypothetical protein PHE79_08525 [Eubacteriales bacterium]|nr:hypothetical protein [Eubacteriales bacterium]